MRRDLLSLQAQMEASAREIWHHLASGQPVPQTLRTTCDELVVAVEDAERELADARAAIEGAGDEIAAHLARRLQSRLQSAKRATVLSAVAPAVDACPWMR